MPVQQCSNGKWRIGDGPCVYDTKADAEEAQQAIHAGDKHNNDSYFSFRDLVHREHPTRRSK